LCGCKKREKKQSGTPTEKKSAAREEKAVHSQRGKAQQSGIRSGELESVARKEDSGTPTERKSAARERGN